MMVLTDVDYLGPDSCTRPMLSTNLLDMMKDPYSEDRQLAATTETTTTINAFNNSGLFSNHYLENMTGVYKMSTHLSSCMLLFCRV